MAWLTMDIHKDNFLFFKYRLDSRDTVGRSSMKSVVEFFNCEGGECKLIWIVLNWWCLLAPWFSSGIQSIGSIDRIRNIVTSMQEVFHVMDTSYYYVVGALSGAVALHCNMRPVGEVALLSISPELLKSATRPWKLACWDCYCVVWQLVLWFSWKWLLKARIMAMWKHFFWNWELL